MKHLKIHIALLLLITLLSLAVTAQTPNYTAPAYGKSLVEKGNFSDIGQSPSADNILKLRMMNIIQGSAGTKYNPEALLTRQEAATYIIRILDKEKEALEKGESKAKGNAKTDYIADKWAVGYIEEAIAQGIITKDDLKQMGNLTKAQTDAIDRQVTAEAKKQWMTIAQRDALKNEKTAAAILQNKNMKQAISREDLALWLFRAFKLEEIPQKDINHIYKYSDWNSVSGSRIGIVEAMIQKDIITGASKDKYNPNGGVKRAEAADILSKVIATYPEIPGITMGTARLTGINRTYKTDTTGTQNDTTYTMEKFDGTEFNVILEKDQSFPVIEKGKVYSHNALKEGDTVEYGIRDEKILYAALDIYGFVQGALSYHDENAIIRIEDNQKKVTELRMNANTLITAMGKPAKSKSLIVGQPVKALYKKGMIIQLDIMETVDYYDDVEYTDGIIKYIDKAGKIIKFEDYDGNMRVYDLDDRLEVTINDYYENIDNLQTEQDATFEITGRRVKAIKAFTTPGMDVSKEYLAFLRVREIDGNTIRVTPPEDRQNSMIFKADNLTSLTYLGYPIKLHNIKVGDLVKIKANESDKERIQSIELMTKRQRVENIYKASILDTLPTEYKLALSNVHTYKYSDWIKINNENTFPVKRDAQIYKDGRKLTLEDLDKQRGVEAYIATVSDFGQETIAKITLKSISEDSVLSGSFNTEWTTNTIQLANGEKLNFDEGTIILKDRRLLDTSDLTYNKEAFVVKNKLQGGQNYAAFMSLENANGFDYRNVVRGYIHDMGEDNFSLESYANLINNQWDYYYDGEAYFYVSKDSKILDNVVKKSFISRDTFLDSRFWEKRISGDKITYAPADPNRYTIHDPEQYMDDKGPHYEKCKQKSRHMLAYAVISEDGEAIAINIYKRDNGLGKEDVKFTENYKSGEVVSINNIYTQLSLTDVKEYSQFYDRWQPTGSKDVINTVNSLIIKNEQVVNLSDLTPGDRIYAITDKNNGIIIFVE